VITQLSQAKGKLLIRGTASDNGIIKRVVVNGQAANALAPNFSEWQITLDNPADSEGLISAHAEDAAGNVEKMPHVVRIQR
jgi:hypothetical protein